MKTLSTLLLTVVGASLPIALCAQTAPVSTGSLVRSSAVASSGTYTPSSMVMIENRARTLGDRATASRTRYFAVTDFDVLGKTQEEVAKRLSPTVITAGDAVRRVEILVDLQRPITIYASADEPVSIGTAIVEGAGLRNIDVRSSIVANDLKIVRK